jgi:hypothetical protein
MSVNRTRMVSGYLGRSCRSRGCQPPLIAYDRASSSWRSGGPETRAPRSSRSWLSGAPRRGVGGSRLRRRHRGWPWPECTLGLGGLRPCRGDAFNRMTGRRAPISQTPPCVPPEVEMAWGKPTPPFSADGASLVGVGALPSEVILFGCIACGSRPRVRDRDGVLRLTCGMPACVRGR